MVVPYKFGHRYLLQLKRGFTTFNFHFKKIEYVGLGVLGRARSTIIIYKLNSNNQ
jgi:hypothetical protein